MAARSMAACAQARAGQREHDEQEQRQPGGVLAVARQLRPEIAIEQPVQPREQQVAVPHVDQVERLDRVGEHLRERVHACHPGLGQVQRQERQDAHGEHRRDGRHAGPALPRQRPHAAKRRPRAGEHAEERGAGQEEQGEPGHVVGRHQPRRHQQGGERAPQHEAPVGPRGERFRRVAGQPGEQRHEADGQQLGVKGTHRHRAAQREQHGAEQRPPGAEQEASPQEKVEGREGDDAEQDVHKLGAEERVHPGQPEQRIRQPVQEVAVVETQGACVGIIVESRRPRRIAAQEVVPVLQYGHLYDGIGPGPEQQIKARRQLLPEEHGHAQGQADQVAGSTQEAAAQAGACRAWVSLGLNVHVPSRCRSLLRTGASGFRHRPVRKKAGLGSPSAGHSNGPSGPSEPLASSARTRQGGSPP